MKSRKREELYKSIKKALAGAPKENDDVAYILHEIETETFLPKQLTPSNGVIPNQVHLIELEKILANAQEYLPLLSVKDETGLTAKEKLLYLFSFQIPYYVGPTSSDSERSDGNGWVVRKKDGPVLPWTLEDTVDLQKTSERFIERMIRLCTYISGEKVLPKGSLQYEKFNVLNEINNIRINGDKLSVQLKQEIFQDLFEAGKKVSRRTLVSYLRNRGLLEEDVQLTGIDKQINNSLSSYGKFYAILGDKIKEDRYRDMAEDAIFWGTVYGDDRKFITQNLKDTYGDLLTEDQIRRISGFKFRDWGRMSRAFLQMQGCHKPTGEVMTLLEALWSDENNSNMMELLHSDLYTFGEELHKKQNNGLQLLDDFTYEDLDEMYFSPPVKRMVWQTMLIIRELKKILGTEPARVFIEMTRTDETKGDVGRKDSRRKQLETLYKQISTETAEWKKEMLDRIAEADSNGKLRSKKLYLYFTQMGRCMYTGRPIELGDLFNDNLYDIDHIYPRHYVKDDNINNNLVLVYKPKNARKSDVYPIEAEIRNDSVVSALWKNLLKHNLITEEKFRRLTGNKPFTDDQLAGFIARQMVETSQGTKGVADLLGQLLHEGTEIVYAKAGNVSDFRRDYGLLKSRSVNDFHHAQDAYLNIVIGNAYYVKFTRDPRNFIVKEFRKDREKYNYHLDRMLQHDIRRGEETAWVAERNGVPGTIATVKSTMARNTPLMTRMNFVGHGGIADETLYGAVKAKPGVYIPLKSSDPKMMDVEKYGGLNKVKVAYFFLVEHGKAGKRVRTLETVPIYLKDRLEGSEEALLNYCKKDLQLEDPEIRAPKIKLQSLIRQNGFLLHLSGKTGNRILLRNAVNLCLRQEWVNYIHDIDRFVERGLLKESLSKDKNVELYKLLVDKHTNGIYRNRPNSVGNTLQNGMDRFKGLPVEKQVQALNQIIRLSSIGTASGDLRLIDGAEKSGTLKVGKKISENDEFNLIHQSITGIFENEIDLLKV